MNPYSFHLSPSYSSQSATSTHQECPRRYLFNYRLYGIGIVPKWSSIPLTTGGCVHCGTQDIAIQHLTNKDEGVDIDLAVEVALKEYTSIVQSHPLAITGKGTLPEQEMAIFQEQLALTEALVRLWYMYEWPKIVQYYDILAVEQEIVFPLTSDSSILYQSKPDLILLHKQNGDVINYSLKTAKSFSDRLEKSYKVQMQASTEPYATGIWLKQFKQGIDESILALIQPVFENHTSYISTKLSAIRTYLTKIGNLPQQSSATRFCYLIKGDFKEDKRGSGIYRTDSSLIYGWRKFLPSGFQYAAINKVPKPENQSGYGLLGKGWERFKVWEDEEVGGIKGWLEMLRNGDRVQNDIGEGPILEKYIVGKPDIYTNPSLIESKLTQIITTEVHIKRNLAELSVGVNGTNVDMMFPMNTNSCHWPSDCPYLSICPNGGDMYRDYVANDPLNPEYNAFERRVPHHKPEKDYFDSLVQIEGA